MQHSFALWAFSNLPDQRVRSLALRLHQLVASSRERLQVDFPQVVDRYATLEKSVVSVQQVRQDMRARGGAFGAYAVTLNKRILGVVTFEQVRLLHERSVWPWPWRQRVELVDGPMIAGWLGNVDRPGGMMPSIMELLAGKLVSSPGVKGTPWTLVRPAHGYVRRLLAAPDTPFGGFDERTIPTKFAYVDGVDVPRILYVARQAVR